MDKGTEKKVKIKEEENGEQGSGVERKPLSAERKPHSLKSHLSLSFHGGPYYFFKKMCDKISVHGFGLIGMALTEAENTKEEGRNNPKEEERNKWAERFSILKVITTVLVLFVSIGGLIYYLDKTYDSYRNTYLSVGLKDPQADLSLAYFPDVTVCNNNLIKMSFLTSIDSQLHTKGKKALRKEIHEYFVTGSNTTISPDLDAFIKKPEFFTRIQLALPHKKKMINKTNAVNFFRQAAVPTCKDMIAAIYWKNKDRTPDMVITEKAINDIPSTEATNFGICCNISPKKLFPNDCDTKDMQGGPHEGISLLIDSQGWDYAFSPHYSEGIRIAASSPNSFNQVQQDGVFLEPGTNTYAALNPRVTEIGSHRPLKYNWSPKDRKCYIGDMERMPGMIDLQTKFPKLKYDTEEDKKDIGNYTTYDYRLCHELVKLNETMTHAKCIPPEYWEILNADHNETELPNLPPCFGPKIKEAHEHEKNRTAAIADYGDRICLRNCATQENNLVLSFSEYPAAAIFEDFPEFEVIQRKIDADYKDPQKKLLMDNSFSGKKPDTKTYTETNMAWLTVYFKYPYVRAYSADVAKTRSAVLSEIGGTMGLFLGISFIGIIELFVHLTKIFMGLITPNKDLVLRTSAQVN